MLPYHPFYCEENAHHRAQALAKGQVWLITNRRRQVAMLHQRAGSPIVWDYHVVAVAHDGIVHDPDCTLDAPVSAASYLDLCFLHLPEAEPFAPVFRVFSAADYTTLFFSDRSHMLDEEGAYRAPPPPWPSIRPEQGNCLAAWLDLDRPDPGRVTTLAQLQKVTQERFA